MLDKYKVEDGWEYDGCHYDDPTDLIQVGILRFCGCGSPEQNIEFVRKGLELIDAQRPGLKTGPNEWRDWIVAHKRRESELFGKDAVASFFYYWADKEQLTEHGGAIPGWLTPKGKELLQAICEVTAWPSK